MEPRVKPATAALQPPSKFTGASSLKTNADMRVSMALIYLREKGYRGSNCNIKNTNTMCCSIKLNIQYGHIRVVCDLIFYRHQKSMLQGLLPPLKYSFSGVNRLWRNEVRRAQYSLTFQAQYSLTRTREVRKREDRRKHWNKNICDSRRRTCRWRSFIPLDNGEFKLAAWT